MPQDDITFVCGALRSGTTLLGLMLDHHPALSNPGEMDFLFECPRTKKGEYDLKRFKQHLELDPIFMRMGLTFQDGLSHDALIRSFIDAQRQPNALLTITIHRHFERIPTLFPDARFIHILRDPRDVAQSAIGMGWAANAYHGVDHWIKSERSFEKLSEAIPAERIYTLKNEALVSNPEAELTKLCEFLGAPYDPAMLDYPKTTTYAPPDPSLAEQWRRVQRPQAIGLVEGKVATMMAQRGYALSGHPVIHPGPLRRFRLGWSNRMGNLGFRIRRFGLFWTALEAFTRRVRIAPLRRAVRRRFNKVGEKYLK